MSTGTERCLRLDEDCTFLLSALDGHHRRIDTVTCQKVSCRRHAGNPETYQMKLLN